MSEPNVVTKGRNGQSNVYIEYDGKGDKHEHYWYDSKTGMMGGHGENASKEDKWWNGVRSGDMKIGG